MTELLHHKKMCTQCQKSPSILRPEHKLHIPYKKIFIVHLRGAIHLKKNKNTTVQRGYGGLFLKLRFPVTWAPNLPFHSRLGVHLMQQQHNVQRRAEAQGRQGEWRADPSQMDDTTRPVRLKTSMLSLCTRFSQQHTPGCNYSPWGWSSNNIKCCAYTKNTSGWASSKIQDMCW